MPPLDDRPTQKEMRIKKGDKINSPMKEVTISNKRFNIQHPLP